MKKYRCIACNFSTDHRPNFQRHIRTSKHKKCSSNVALCSSDVALCSPNVAFSEEIPSPKKVYELSLIHI